ncbi:hypothetical protein D0863_06557 [Hortaea werneckii]|uniref:F-box domain-containing protein n=1 Tax=Hortaea werneckii TaxID=91943 RepID=A0A3M7DY17_HORWE|nr:hypothetical protein D0863_06557 [Hortaea werneckii]
MDSSQQQAMSNLAKNISSLTTTEQHHPPTHQTSPLLTLPPELRNKIYSLALKSPSKTTPSSNTGHLKHPALLQTSVQIRTEATQMYFAQTTFQLPLNPSNLHPLHTFLETCGPANLAVLHKLELQYAVCAAAATGDAYAHPGTKQPSILALLYLLAEAGVRMQGVEASTGRCRCRRGGRCKTTARAWVYAFEMLLGGFRGSGESSGRVGVRG